jgi:hypothetical protein
MEVKIEKQVEDVIDEYGLQEKKETGEGGSMLEVSPPFGYIYYHFISNLLIKP